MGKHGLLLLYFVLIDLYVAVVVLYAYRYDTVVTVLDGIGVRSLDSRLCGKVTAVGGVLYLRRCGISTRCGSYNSYTLKVADMESQTVVGKGRLGNGKVDLKEGILL